jgi:hypothetical protein
VARPVPKLHQSQRARWRSSETPLLRESRARGALDQRGADDDTRQDQTRRYEALMRAIRPTRNNLGVAHENGSIESKFKAVNNRDKNYTIAKVGKRIEQVDASIVRYLAALGRPTAKRAMSLKLRQPASRRRSPPCVGRCRS